MSGILFAIAGWLFELLNTQLGPKDAQMATQIDIRQCWGHFGMREIILDITSGPGVPLGWILGSCWAQFWHTFATAMTPYHSSGAMAVAVAIAIAIIKNEHCNRAEQQWLMILRFCHVGCFSGTVLEFWAMLGVRRRLATKKANARRLEIVCLRKFRRAHKEKHLNYDNVWRHDTCRSSETVLGHNLSIVGVILGSLFALCLLPLLPTHKRQSDPEWIQKGNCNWWDVSEGPRP